MKDNMMELAEPLRAMEGLKDFHEAAWVHKKMVCTICPMLITMRRMARGLTV